ncbi:MAG TPA: ABC transporter permease [Acidimicrobiales bacterium]|nr:ABC transporter permease [Acidimicrobiales bacterium]
MTLTAALVRRRTQMMGRQLYYEQLSFWRNPFGAFFTVGFSLIFLVLLAASGGATKVTFLGVKEVQYYVPGFAAYGVMSACFNTLAISLVNRRETGLLKRIRLSPLPAWAMIGALALNAMVVSVVQVVLLLLVGRFGFGARLPENWAPLVLAIAVGVVCFTALGVAASTLVPNEDAAGPMISIVFFVMLFLSGLWFPLQPGSALAQFSRYFPVGPLIDATFAPFHLVPGASAWSWGNIGVVAIWGAVGFVVAVRRFRFEPRRAK